LYILQWNHQLEVQLTNMHIHHQHIVATNNPFAYPTRIGLLMSLQRQNDLFDWRLFVLMLQLQPKIA